MNQKLKVVGLFKKFASEFDLSLNSQDRNVRD